MQCHLHYSFMDNNALYVPSCSSDGVIFIVIVLFAHLFCKGTNIIILWLTYIMLSLSSFIQ